MAALYFLTKRHKHTLVRAAASVGIAFFVITFLVVVSGIDNKLKPDNPYTWLVPPVVGLVFFLFALGSINVRYHIFLGYKTFDDYLQGEAEKEAKRLEAAMQRFDAKTLRQRFNTWVRHILDGDVP